MTDDGNAVANSTGSPAEANDGNPAPNQPLLSTRPEVFKLLRAYISQRGGAAGGAVAVEALMAEYPKIQPVLAFQIFCDMVLKVDKKLIGSESDPTMVILKTAVSQAPDPEFWALAADDSNREFLVNLLTRCKTLLSVLSRKNAFSETLSVLQLLNKLPLTLESLKQVELPTVIERAGLKSSDENVRNCAQKLADQHPSAFSSGTNAAELPSKVTTLKLFGDGGALRMKTHKRTREHSPPLDSPKHSGTEAESGETSAPLAQDTESMTDKDDASDTMIASPTSPAPKKRRKQTKRVTWKPEKDLVQVRFYEIEGTVRFRSSRSAKLQELEEGNELHVSDREWKTPALIDFGIIFGTDAMVYNLMSVKRGGNKEPESYEAENQAQRELTVPPRESLDTDAVLSPQEPPEFEQKPDPEWMPKQGGRFVASDPSPEWVKESGSRLGGLNGLASTPMLVPPGAGTAPMGMPGMSGMPGMPGMPGIPPMMPMGVPGFGWGMNFPMNMAMGSGAPNHTMDPKNAYHNQKYN